jgi:hypothetical protein
MNIFPTATLWQPYGNPTELQDFKHPMSLQAYLCVMGDNLAVHICIYRERERERKRCIYNYSSIQKEPFI